MNHCQSLFMVRRTSIRFVAAAIGLHVAMTSLINLWAFPRGVFVPLQRATMGLISPTLVASALMAAIMLYFLLKFGELQLKDLDLYASKIPGGLVWLVGGWLLIEGTLLTLHAVNAVPLTIDSRWQGSSAVALVGRLLGQLFGNALYEEVLFRAFLLPQLVLIIKKRFRKWSWWRCLVLGLLISQTVFALIHIPNRIFKGTYQSPTAFVQDQFGLFVAGVVFALIWLLSRNIFVAVGLHALVNAPTSIWSMESYPDAVASLGLVLPILWLRVWWSTRPSSAARKGPA